MKNKFFKRVGKVVALYTMLLLGAAFLPKIELNDAVAVDPTWVTNADDNISLDSTTAQYIQLNRNRSSDNPAEIVQRFRPIGEGKNDTSGTMTLASRVNVPAGTTLPQTSGKYILQNQIDMNETWTIKGNFKFDKSWGEGTTFPVNDGVGVFLSSSDYSILSNGTGGDNFGIGGVPSAIAFVLDTYRNDGKDIKNTYYSGTPTLQKPMGTDTDPMSVAYNALDYVNVPFKSPKMSGGVLPDGNVVGNSAEHGQAILKILQTTDSTSLTPGIFTPTLYSEAKYAYSPSTAYTSDAASIAHNEQYTMTWVPTKPGVKATDPITGDLTIVWHGNDKTYPHGFTLWKKGILVNNNYRVGILSSTGNATATITSQFNHLNFLLQQSADIPVNYLYKDSTTGDKIIGVQDHIKVNAGDKIAIHAATTTNVANEVNLNVPAKITGSDGNTYSFSGPSDFDTLTKTGSIDVTYTKDPIVANNNFWSSTNASPVNNTGDFGTATSTANDLKLYINAKDPYNIKMYSDAEINAAGVKQQVQAKGILGTDVSTGVKWYIDMSGVLHLGAGSTPTMDNNQNKNAFYIANGGKYQTMIKKVIFDGKVTVDPNNTSTGGFPASGRHMFAYLTNLETFTSKDAAGNQLFDTSRMVTMNFMFQGDSKLRNLDLSGLNMSNLQSMENTFRDMTALETIDVSWVYPDKPFNPALTEQSLTWFPNLFKGDKSLNKITGINTWNNKRAGGMNSAFEGVSSLTEVDLSNWDLSGFAGGVNMFAGMTNVQKITLGHDPAAATSTASKIELGNMVSNVPALKTLDLSGLRLKNDATSVVDGMISNAPLLERITFGSSVLKPINVPNATVATTTAGAKLWRQVTKIDNSVLVTAKDVTDAKFVNPLNFSATYTPLATHGVQTYILKQLATLTIKAVDENGKVLPGVLFSVQRTDSGSPSQTPATYTSDKNTGLVTITDVPQGAKYKVVQQELTGYDKPNDQTWEFTTADNKELVFINKTPLKLNLPITGSLARGIALSGLLIAIIGLFTYLGFINYKRRKVDAKDIDDLLK